ncbi:MAG: hypothetical protein ABIH23_32580 [bacterium]
MKRRRKNPLELMVVNPQPSEKAVRTFKMWHGGKEPPEVNEIEMPDFDEVIFAFRVKEIHYDVHEDPKIRKIVKGTPKEGRIPFRHKFNRPYPIGLINKDQNAILIIQGKGIPGVKPSRFRATDWLRG